MFRRMNAPTIYDMTTNVMQALDFISKGSTITRACALAGISVAAFQRHIRQTEGFADLYAEAEQNGYDAMADALLDPVAHPEYGSTDPKMAKVYGDNIKWFLARKKPSTYGDKVTVTHEITADRAITDLLQAAHKRAIDQVVQPAIDVEYKVVEQPVQDDVMSLFKF